MFRSWISAVIFLIFNFSLTIATAVSWGHIENQQILLFDQFFSDRGEFLTPVDFFFSTRGITITAIHVTDLTGVEGGTAIIEQGGVGYTFVKMKLIPDDFKLLLNVEIFGCHDERFLFKR